MMHRTSVAVQSAPAHEVHRSVASPAARQVLRSRHSAFMPASRQHHRPVLECRHRPCSIAARDRHAERCMPDPTALLASLVFGVIGLSAFLYGKKHALFVPMTLGIALMIFPYFVASTLWMCVIGVALVAAIWFFRE